MEDPELILIHTTRLTVRTLVAGRRHLQLSGCSQHAPRLFFNSVFKTALSGLKSTEAFLGELEKKRLLISLLPHSQNENGDWERHWDSMMARSETFVRTLVQFFRTFGYKKDFDFQDMIIKYSLLEYLNLSLSQTKLHTVYLSGLTRKVTSPIDKIIGIPGLLLDYASYRWVKQKCTKNTPSYSRMRDYLGETLLLGIKRGFPSMHDNQVDQTVRDYMQYMSTGGSAPADMLSEIERTCNELFRFDQSMVYRDKQDRIHPLFEEVCFALEDFVEKSSKFQISRRAGFKAPIRYGGILGHLIRNEPKEESFFGEFQLLHMYEKFSGIVVSRYGLPINSLSLFRYYREKLLTSECLKTQVYVIREPLKVRTITAGTPEAYGILKPLQRAMWERLRTYEQFKLIGEPMSDELLNRVMNKPLPDDSWWYQSYFISGDYSAATNEMYMNCTTTAYETIFGQKDNWNLCRLALGQQEIHAKLSTKEELVVTQMRGQLMGSPLSFPILCVINIAALRATMEEYYGRSFLVSELPCLVNGDDILVRCNDPKFHELWKNWIKKVGWRESPGKSYFLQDYCQINSETHKVIRLPVSDIIKDINPKTCNFSYETARMEKPYYVFESRIPYVNFGFMNSLKKATKQFDGPCMEMFSLDWRSRFDEILQYPMCLQRSMIHYTLWNLDRVLQDCVDYGRTPFKLSIYNPVDFGGLGISDRVIDFEVAKRSLSYESSAPRLDLSDIYSYDNDSSIAQEIESEELLVLKRNLLEERKVSDEELLEEILNYCNISILNLDRPKSREPVTDSFVVQESLCMLLDEQVYSREIYGHTTFGRSQGRSFS